MDSKPSPTEQTPPSASVVPSSIAEAAGLRLTAVTSLIEHLDPPDRAASSIPSSLLDAETRYQNQLVQVRLGLATSLFTALRAKHAPTAAHCLRVALRSSAWGLVLGLDEKTRDELEVAALLHDIGKIGVPDRILLKPDRLSGEEVATINRHRQIGQQILLSCCASENVLSIVKYAPAWWDGSRAGFDRSGEELPREARIVSIADAYDAMTTDQVYRRAMSRERAIAELYTYAGTQFDPALVDRFSELLSFDPTRLTAEVSKRWLNELTPQRSNALWNGQGHSVAQLEMPASTEALFHEKLLNSMHDGVVFIDVNMQVLLWNRATERLTGLRASSVLHQRWSTELIGLRDENGVFMTTANCPVAHTLRSRVQSFRRLTIEGAGGEQVSVDVHMVPVIGPDGIMQGATLLLHDASPQVNMEQRIESLHLKATRDPLTNIANRAEFDRVHAEFVDTHLQRGRPCALIICDIDHFKQVNDTYGHQAGDEVLISFASLLQRAVEKGDLVARYGGEEFVMLCADCDNAAVTQRAEMIRQELEDTKHACLKNRSITASFGVTEIQAGDTPETMLRRADRALLRAKESGRNRVVQLGTGIPEALQRERRNLLQRWLRPAPASCLLEQTLITAVPIAVTMEKLRGFISDHHAEIVATEDGKLQLRITKDSIRKRRANDRQVSFIVSLQFFEKPIEQKRSAAGSAHTVIRVGIRLANSRDRRMDNAYERARQLFASLKSYFMAQTFDGVIESENATPPPSLFQRLLDVVHLRTRNK